MKLIGITSSAIEARISVNATYHNALARPGVLPVALPIFPITNRETITLDEYCAQHADLFAAYADQLDALCCSGGPDINPVLFGESNWGASGCNGERDMMEIGLIRAFVAAEKPILGICKGMQLINLALGLKHFQQDLEMTKELHQAAARELKDRQEPVHSVYVFGAYRDYLREKTGRDDLSSLVVCSHHHQGFTVERDGKIPKGVKTHDQYVHWYTHAIAAYEQANDIRVLAATAMVIEGVERPSIKYVGHQHHPECSGPNGLAIGYWLDRYVADKAAD